MPSFTALPSYQRLKALSKNLVNLTDPNIFNRKRIESMQKQACSFSYFYGAERISDEGLFALFSLAKEAKALEKMKDMQNGEVINRIEGYPSEERMVLHTAMRDFFSEKNQSKPAKDAANFAYAEIEKLKSFLTQIGDKYSDIVQVGIGGSDLGPRAIYHALEAYNLPGRRAHFISNVDPDDAVAVTKKLDLKKTLFIIVSKSGSTLETLTNESLVRDFLKKKGLSPKEHILSVTGKDSPMDDPKKYLKSFYMQDYVGGRYSATSMVGCVLLGFCLGIESLIEFLKGASEMDKHAYSSSEQENLPLLAALIGIWNRNFLDLPTTAVIPYSQALHRFTAHLQQCDMESNGKQIDKKGNFVQFETGPIIWGEPGTNGQHSFYQLIHQGTTTIALEFIGFKETQYKKDLEVKNTTSQEKLLSNLFAQSIALAMGQKSDNPNKTFLGNRPNSLLLARCLDPKTMGALLAFYEHKVAFQGFIWDINSFDQEGVQLGKVLANKILDQFASQRTKEKVEAFPQVEVFLEVLKNL